MKRIISLVLIALTFAFCLASCGQTESDAYEMKTPTTKSVAEAIKNSTEFEELIELTSDNITSRYFFDAETVEEFTVMVCSNAAIGDEIAIFKLKDKEKASAMIDVVEMRKTDRMDALESYAPDEKAKVEKGVIGRKGNYVYFIVAKDVEKAKEACENCF